MIYKIVLKKTDGASAFIVPDYLCAGRREKLKRRLLKILRKEERGRI